MILGLPINFGGRHGLSMGPPPSPNRMEYPFVGTINFRGITIHVENDPGSVRSGKGADGKPWRTKMRDYYGEIPGTRGSDNEPVDVFVGKDMNAPLAFVIYQKTFDGTAESPAGTYDESKIMLGYPTEADAMIAYQRNYNRSVLSPGVTALPVDDLRDQLKQSDFFASTMAKGGGPYIGPKGGKWADPAHTVAWHEDKHAPQRIMDMPVERKEHFVYEGVSNELYAEKGGKGGAVRVYDLDSDQTVGIKKFPTYKAAHAHFYDKMFPPGHDVRLISKGGGPYIGPKGGKWADPKHTVHYEEPKAKVATVPGEWEADPSKTSGDAKAGDIVEVGGQRGRWKFTPDHAKATAGLGWVQSQNTDAYKLVRLNTITVLRPKQVRKLAPPPPKRAPPKITVSLPPTPRSRVKESPEELSPEKPAPPEGSLRLGSKVPMAIPFDNSNAHEGTLMHTIEHGGVPLARYKDEKYKGWRWGIHLDAAQKNQLATELAPLINKVVHDTARRYNLNLRQRKEAVDDVRSAAYVGMVMAISRYKGGASFGWLAKQLATLYAGREAANLMHAGTVPDHKLALVRGFIAAKHQARALAKEEPTNEQVARQWNVTKRHVFEGEKARLGKYRAVDASGKSKIIDQSSETLPMDDWKLLDPSGKPVDDRLYMGKRSLMVTMDALASGQAVKNSEWMEQHPTLPQGGQEPLALRAMLQRDAYRVLEKMPKKEAKALQMLFGFAPYGEPMRREEIADALKLGPAPKPGRKATSEITKRRAANEFIDNAAQQFKLIAEHQEHLPGVAHSIGRWIHRAPDAGLEGFEGGPSFKELETKYGTPERVRIYGASVRAGTSKRTAKILEKEKAGTATEKESRKIREEFHAQRDKERLAQFRLYTSHRSIDPSEVKETGAEAGSAGDSPWLYADTILSDYMTAVAKRGKE